MYGGGNTFEGVKTDSVAKEDLVKLAEFEARIARGEKIEPADWMPELYRKQLILSARSLRLETQSRIRYAPRFRVGSDE